MSVNEKSTIRNVSLRTPCLYYLGLLYVLVHLLYTPAPRGDSITYIYRLICREGVSNKYYVEIQILEVWFHSKAVGLSAVTPLEKNEQIIAKNYIAFFEIKVKQMS